MSLRIIRRAAAIEMDDNFHIARLLLLIAECKTGPLNSIDGLTKLAKLDFLLRYPACLQRALIAIGSLTPAEFSTIETNSIESRMIRYRYGPWDKRYRRWLSLLSAKDLVVISKVGRTIHVRPTDKGIKVAAQFSENNNFVEIANRSKVISKTFSKMGGTKLKDMMYQTFPELLSLKWGEDIAI
jgi:hypothetical protein